MWMSFTAFFWRACEKIIQTRWKSDMNWTFQLYHRAFLSLSLKIFELTISACVIVWLLHREHEAPVYIYKSILGIFFWCNLLYYRKQFTFSYHLWNLEIFPSNQQLSSSSRSIKCVDTISRATSCWKSHGAWLVLEKSYLYLDIMPFNMCED